MAASSDVYVQPPAESAACTAAAAAAEELQETTPSRKRTNSAMFNGEQLIGCQSVISYKLTCFILDDAPLGVTVQVFHQSGAESHATNVVQ